VKGLQGNQVRQKEQQFRMFMRSFANQNVHAKMYNGNVMKNDLVTSENVGDLSKLKNYVKGNI
jgi:archaellum biogenesis protein FlaJ (TadC family)